jgi:hypothetical protein
MQMQQSNNKNMNILYQSPPIQIQNQQQQQPTSHNNTTSNTPQLTSYASTPPNSNIMNSSSFSPVTNTYFSPSFNSISSGYFNAPNQSPPLRPQQPLSQPTQQYQTQTIQMPLQMPLQYQNNMAAGVNAVLGQSIKTYKIYRPYFQLEMYVPNITSASNLGIEGAFAISSSLRSLYEKLVAEHNQATFPSIVGSPSEYNAGFDLLAPCSAIVGGYNTVKIDHLVKCRMTKIIPHSSHPINMFQDSNGILRQYNTTILPVGFYLYPRSSTGTKTPLRLANSVGIIDSGYRGPLIAAFDNWKRDDYEIQDKQRLVQVCPPDLSYPIYVILVDSEEELGKTARGSGGFGSTG